MKKCFYLSISLLLFSFGKAQNTNTSFAKNSISNHYNKAQILAFQNTSSEKFEQFADYFNLLQNTNDAELNAQIKQAIFSLFENPETEIQDFLGSNEKLPLREFLEKYQNSKQKLYIVSKKNEQQVFQNSWLNVYQIKTDSGKTIDLQQMISFEINEKKFGSKTKEVWELKLGEISVKP